MVYCALGRRHETLSLDIVVPASIYEMQLQTEHVMQKELCYGGCSSDDDAS